MAFLLSSLPHAVSADVVGIVEDTFKLELFAKLLEPGWQKTIARRGDEIRFGPVDWIAPTYGSVRAEMWGVVATVVFETDDRRKQLRGLRIFPIVKNKDESPWNLWRHRHGYQYFAEKGYLYSSLEDIRPVMDPNSGAFYDRALRNAWGYWIKKRLPDYLKNGDTTKGADWSSVPDSGEDVFKMVKPLRLRYSSNGVHGSASALFQINLWHVPVKIDFEVARSTRNAENSYIGLPRGYRWRFDMVEWRRRHGYRKTLFGDYKWEEGFPDERALTKKDGELLDELLKKNVETWVDAAMAQVIFDLNLKVGRAVGSITPSKTPSYP